MSYSKTLASCKDTAIIEVTGWDKPALAISQAYLADILKTLAIIEADILSSKTGVAGMEIHNVQQELSALLRGCSGFIKAPGG